VDQSSQPVSTIQSSAAVAQYIAQGLVGGFTVPLSSSSTSHASGQQSPSSTDASTPTPAPSNGSTHTRNVSNVTQSITRDCWDQWATHWAVQDRVLSYVGPLGNGTGTTAYSGDFTITQWWSSTSGAIGTRTTTIYAGTIPIETTVITTSLTRDVNGGQIFSTAFAGTYEQSGLYDTYVPIYTYFRDVVTTSTEVVTIVGVDTYSPSISTSASFLSLVPAVYTALTQSISYSKVTGTLDITATPSCTLPAYLSQCQAEWEAWVTIFDYGFLQSEWATPRCSQASFAPARCDRLRTSYIGAHHGSIWSSYSADDTLTSSQYWPASTEIGPGCTLGCQECMITGDKVQLM
jgi:hypothetical protein